MAIAVVFEDRLRRAVIPDSDIQIAVAIEIGERRTVARGKLFAKPPGRTEEPVAVVQETRNSAAPNAGHWRRRRRDRRHRRHLPS